MQGINRTVVAREALRIAHAAVPQRLKRHWTAAYNAYRENHDVPEAAKRALAECGRDAAAHAVRLLQRSCAGRP